MSIKSFSASSALALLHIPISPSPSHSPDLHFPTTTTRRRNSPFRIQSQTTNPISSSSVEPRKEDVVIVGAGIAGLATALSLHRLGVRSLVLEQADSLRTGGTSLTLFKNGWRVLDAIGVGDELRPQFLEIQGLVIRAEDGRELRSFKFRDESESQEVRAVERRILLETLASKLPPDAICFSSKLAKIEKTQTGETILELVDGTQLLSKHLFAVFEGFMECLEAGTLCSCLRPDGDVGYHLQRALTRNAKTKIVKLRIPNPPSSTVVGQVPYDMFTLSVNYSSAYYFMAFWILQSRSDLVELIVIGCDGIRSPTAKWMGFSEPQYVGHCAFRGLGSYPNGQPFEPRVSYVYGRGLRAGYVPVSSSKVYWFICFNKPSPGPKITDPSLLKKEAQELIKSWPSELVDVINETPDDTIIRTPLVDRWLWPTLSPSVLSGGVVLAGDAWHPMTPNLGQGACCALEDAVVLAKKLAGVLDAGPTSINDALRSYETERWARVFPLTVRANLVGALLQWGNPLVCAVRNNIVIPKLVKLGPLLEHTNFSCEPLN